MGLATSYHYEILLPDQAYLNYQDNFSNSYSNNELLYMNGVVRVTTHNFTCTPFFSVNIRIVGTDVYAAVTIRMHGY
jgi:hypothetical protein